MTTGKSALVLSAAMLLVAEPAGAQLGPAIERQTTECCVSGQRVGEVTTAQGQVTLTRAAAPPAPLRFREAILVRDRIRTGERSLARILFGRKALVTVTERSVITVTDTPDASVIDMRSPGRLALAVAHDRMRPGEAIEIRTPHAVAAVRGTVVVAEVLPGPDGRLLTRFTVLKGIVDVTRIDAASTASTTLPLHMNESAEVRDAGPVSLSVLSETEASSLASEFRVSPAASPVAVSAVTDAHLKQALADAARLGREAGVDAKRQGPVDDVRQDDDAVNSVHSDHGLAADGVPPDRAPTADFMRSGRGPADALRPDRGPVPAVDLSRGAGPPDHLRPAGVPDVFRALTVPAMSHGDGGALDTSARDAGKQNQHKR